MDECHFSDRDGLTSSQRLVWTELSHLLRREGKYIGGWGSDSISTSGCGFSRRKGVCVCIEEVETSISFLSHIRTRIRKPFIGMTTECWCPWPLLSKIMTIQNPTSFRFRLERRHRNTGFRLKRGLSYSIFDLDDLVEFWSKQGTVSLRMMGRRVDFNREDSLHMYTFSMVGKGSPSRRLRFWYPRPRSDGISGSRFWIVGIGYLQWISMRHTEKREGIQSWLSWLEVFLNNLTDFLLYVPSTRCVTERDSFLNYIQSIHNNK